MSAPCEIWGELDPRSYPIRIGAGLLELVGTCCAERGLCGRCLVVADENTAPLFAATVLHSLERAGFSPALKTLPAGEETKGLATLVELYDALLAHGMDRKSFVVALGGGVVGDLAGYAAATFLRGISFVQVPTTLLAMVDSSVGGKTGINLPQGKNLVGAFHQPQAVLIDLAALGSLPPREYRAGLAEVIKYGLICDAGFLDWLDRELERVDRAPQDLNDSARRDSTQQLLSAMVARCCEIKAEVVGRDECEGGLRAILNFGHTVGHGIENSAGYGVYLHGEAVAVGMRFAVRAAVRSGLLPESESERIDRLLRGLHLPLHAPGCDWDSVRRAMTADKKTVGGMLKFVLIGPAGCARTGCELPEAWLEELWHGLGE